MIRVIRASLVALLTGVGLIILTDPADAGRCFFYDDEIGMVCDGRVDPEPGQFEDPDEIDGGVLEYASYAYMDDNINIYPEPNLSAPPLYNVGEGFLYVTIQGVVEANGHKWYVINPGEYALAEGIRPIETPDFTGVEVTVQPERPFGWVVREVQPSSQPDGEPNPEFTKLERFSFFQIFDAVMGEDDWIWYQIGGDRWIKQTHVSLVDVQEPAEEVGPDEFWVEIDLYEQTFAAYEGERMVYASLISSGLNRWPTYEGLFQVWDRFLQTKMSGAEGKVDYYFVEDVPYAMYFDRQNEIALHGAYWHDRYGYKHSHGCVNMPPRDAEWIYYWSGDAPNALWVWVHTSEPDSYFQSFVTDGDSGSAGAY